MSIVVTGATGHLGRLAISALRRRGVAPDQITAAGRSVERVADLAAEGVAVSRISFDDPESLRAAFAGADRVLLVSGSELGQRIAQHRNAIEAARAAGVGLLVYTSVAHADRSSLRLAEEHLATERLIRESGLPYTFLRNSWYLELYTEPLATTLANGAILGSAGEGRVSAATRVDYAEAAAAVLAGDGHANAVYELGGDDPFTLPDLAAEISRQSGRPVAYQNLPVDEYRRTLVGFGLPEPVAAVYADADRGLSENELLVETGDLARLIGRPPTTMPEAIAAALATPHRPVWTTRQ